MTTNLDDLANKIAASGLAEDALTSDLVKGMKGAVDEIKTQMGGLLELVKGRKPPPADDAKDSEDGGDDKDEDEEDDKDGDDDDAGGYRDMQMGSPDPMINGTQAWDVTQFCQDLDANVRNMAVGHAELHASQEKLIKRLAKSEKANLELSRALAGALGSIALMQSELAKAVTGLSGRLIAEPESVVDVAALAARARATSSAGKRDERITQVRLAKALNERIISTDQLHAFKRTGQFVITNPDAPVPEAAAMNTTLIEKVAAL